jgi:hypothetical protein
LIRKNNAFSNFQSKTHITEQTRLQQKNPPHGIQRYYKKRRREEIDKTNRRRIIIVEQQPISNVLNSTGARKKKQKTKRAWKAEAKAEENAINKIVQKEK